MDPNATQCGLAALGHLQPNKEKWVKTGDLRFAPWEDRGIEWIDGDSGFYTWKERVRAADYTCWLYRDEPDAPVTAAMVTRQLCVGVWILGRGGHRFSFNNAR